MTRELSNKITNGNWEIVWQTHSCGINTRMTTMVTMTDFPAIAEIL